MTQSSQEKISEHDRIYRWLRSEIMEGMIAPGNSFTIRGIADRFQVSMTPAREAVRRLSAEGALFVNKTGRISTPKLTVEHIEELAAIRALLEPELGARALPRVHSALIEKLADANARLIGAIRSGDARGYLKVNIEFHRALYLRAQAPSMLRYVETVWLQLGPTMAHMYETLRRPGVSIQHEKIIAALRAGDEPSLRLAIRADVTQGLRMLAAVS